MVTETSSSEAAVWRYLLATITLILLNINNLPTWKLVKANVRPIIMVGGVGLFCFNFFFFKGMALTTPINAVLIIGLNPALTLILSAIILKNKMNLKQVLGVLVAMCGVLYLLFKGDISQIYELNFAKGDLLIMFSSLFFALHHVLVKKYSGRVDNSQFSLMTATICLLLLSITLFFVSLDEGFMLSKIYAYSSSFWIGAIGIGCFGTGIAYWFWYKGIELSSAPKAAMFINIVPLSGSVFAVFMGDALFMYHFVSCFLIVFGILIMQVNFQKKGVVSK